MWGSNDQRKKAEEERKKKDIERQEKAKKAKADRKLKKKADEKKAEEAKKKRDEGREEADKASAAFGEGSEDSSPKQPLPVLRRAGFGGMTVSFSNANPVTSDNLTHGKKYMPPGSSQPGVDNKSGEDSCAHRQTATATSPQPSFPALKRPF
jgi:hypothetical protein